MLEITPKYKKGERVVAYIDSISECADVKGKIYTFRINGINKPLIARENEVSVLETLSDYEGYLESKFKEDLDEEHDWFTVTVNFYDIGQIVFDYISKVEIHKSNYRLNDRNYKGSEWQLHKTDGNVVIFYQSEVRIIEMPSKIWAEIEEGSD